MLITLFGDEISPSAFVIETLSTPSCDRIEVMLFSLILSVHSDTGRVLIQLFVHRYFYSQHLAKGKIDSTLRWFIFMYGMEQTLRIDVNECRKFIRKLYELVKTLEYMSYDLNIIHLHQLLGGKVMNIVENIFLYTTNDLYLFYYILFWPPFS